MLQHLQRILVVVIFLLSLAAACYFASQLQQDNTAAFAGNLAADKGYGVTIDLTKYSDDKTLQDTLTKLHNNGLIWLRQPVMWNIIEPTPGQYNWDALDRILAAVTQHNKTASQAFGQLRLIAVLHTSPRWARLPHTPATSPPVNVSDFGNFARAFAGRYGEQINHYQIWHEPNLSANWGQTYIDANGYTNLLRDAALNIRTVDTEALILTAALAPTLENGPLNLNELDYLAQLYHFKAAAWFDIVAGQPYGFDRAAFEPAQADTLNFQRLVLLRQVMLAHGDADTPIWATAFGWNVLPTDWTGQPSPWRTDSQRYDPPTVQLQRTAEGITWARQHWPWLGPMLAIRWDSTGLTETDPGRGFAISETPVQEVLNQAATAAAIATIGRYPADHSTGQYSPGWRTALNRVDIPRSKPRTLTIPFHGTRLDLTVQRGPYQGYLWVTIDGHASGTLPTDTSGRSYVVLYDPLRQRETVTLAQNLAPGSHQAVITAEGGWGQWAILGWTVSHNEQHRTDQAGLLFAAVVALISGCALVWQFRAPLRTIRLRGLPWKKRPQLLVRHPVLFGEPAQTGFTLALALAVWLLPPWPAMILLLPLSGIILYRPDLGLALIAFSLSFFQRSLQLPFGSFFITETLLLVSTLGFGLRILTLRPRQHFQLSSLLSRCKALDWAALALLLLGLISTLAASNFGVSMFEWRLLLLGSVLYYFLVRLGCDFGPLAKGETAIPPLRWVWRLLDAFVAGAVLHAALVLVGYFAWDQFVVAEGVRRATTPFYDSPNNLALYLDRVWPILLAVTLLPRPGVAKTGRRRWLYGLGLVIVSLALFFTFSNGALMLGLPAGVVMMMVFYLLANRTQHRGRAVVLGAAGLLLALALIPFSQAARFRTIFSFAEGSTGFFRLKLWQASLNILNDHWLLGVGLNNFLYQYRTRYILPEAWQEPNLSHPHNILLDFGTRLGIGGVAILFWLQGAFWLNAWRLYKHLPEPFILGLMGSMAVFISHGLIDNSFFLVDLAFVFFLTCGIVQRLVSCNALD